MSSLLPLALTTRHYVTPRDTECASRHATEPKRSCLHPTCLTGDDRCRIQAVSLVGVFLENGSCHFPTF